MRADKHLGRWPLLVMIVALAVCLLPGPAVGQGIKDAVDDDQATEEATEEPFDPVEQSSDWEEAGLLSDDSYESPLFGYTVDWSGDWALDVYYDPPVISDAEIEQDLLYLLWSGGPDEEAYVIISGQTVNRGGPEGEVEEWTDPDYIETQWEPNLDVEVLLDDTTRDAGAVLYSVIDSEEPDSLVYYTIYQVTELDDGTTLYLTFSASEVVVEDAYASWSEDVEIDGEPVAVVFDWDDIEAAI